MAILSAIGLVLAMAGIYGVISYFVSLRTSEIGLRMALGARARDVMGHLLRQGLGPVMVGLAMGGGLALAAMRLLRGSLYGVSAADPISYLAVALIFVVVATLAILLPGRKAMRIDPTRALEAE